MSAWDISDGPVNTFVAKIKQHLLTSFGMTIENAQDGHIYRALAEAIKEDILMKKGATGTTFKKNDARTIHYLCMEYMPGRLIPQTLDNMNVSKFVREALSRLGRNFEQIMDIDPDPGLGYGGLGRLAACFMESLASENYPAMGYGVRYQYGIFKQEFWRGKQVELPDDWLKHAHPWEMKRTDHSVEVQFGGILKSCKTARGEEFYRVEAARKVRAVPYDYPMVGMATGDIYSVLPLRLWSTKESPRNFDLHAFNMGELVDAAEDTLLTDVLYPGTSHPTGRRIKLKLQFLFASASMQDMIRSHLQKYPNLDNLADKNRIHLNDSYPNFAILELIRLIVLQNNYTFGEAVEMVAEMCSFTNHTLVKAALEEWDRDYIRMYLPLQDKIALKLQELFDKKYKLSDTKSQDCAFVTPSYLKMSELAVVHSHSVNGVSGIHTDILKKDVFPQYVSLFPKKFTNITNGISHRKWLHSTNPELSALITSRIGDGWIRHFTEIKKFGKFATDAATQNELMAIKQNNKKKLLEALKENLIRNEHGVPVSAHDFLDTTALYSMQVKRFIYYKRQLLNLLNLLILHDEISKGGTCVPRMHFMAGKAAPDDWSGKRVQQLAYMISRFIHEDEKMKGKLCLAVIEDYSVSKAEFLIPAADLSEQISCAGWEASGTGNMKLAMNGALTIGTNDGANIEMRESIGNDKWPFLFGLQSNEVAKMKKDRSYDPRKLAAENPLVAKAVRRLTDGSLVRTEEEKESIAAVYRDLFEYNNWGGADTFFILADLPAYHAAQKNVDALFQNPTKWAELAIHQIAGMGPFSTDTTVANYAKVWGVSPLPLDVDEHHKMQAEYDRLRGLV